ncbi:MAG: response regulator [Firmicutes bacterium]|nr:response regulator [Bacillota bacterium]
MKILVVDDANLARAMLRKILEDNGFKEVLEAASGMEAIDLYQEHHPALVTMDITMPEMDGITAIKKIREIDPNANIIVCSALGQKEVIMEAIEAGAKHFLVKPFEADQAIKIIKALLS